MVGGGGGKENFYFQEKFGSMARNLFFLKAVHTSRRARGRGNYCRRQVRVCNFRRQEFNRIPERNDKLQTLNDLERNSNGRVSFHCRRGNPT